MIVYEYEKIAGKDMYIVPVHQAALQPWARVRMEISAPFTVLTLDHHSDCNVALAQYGSIIEPRYKEKLAAFLKQYRYSYPDEMLGAVTEIKNNQQLDAAVKMDILSRALVICLELGCSEAERDRQIFAVEATRPNGPATERLVDQVLETAVLHACLSRLRELAPAALGADLLPLGDFVLDLDLDYFHTAASLRPVDPSLFYSLIQSCRAVTVARETSYVESGWHPHGTYPGDDVLLSALKEHIRKACPGLA